MKKYNYEARDQATNKLSRASVQADSENEAARLLIKQGFVPLSIKEQIGDGSLLAQLTGRITTKDRVVFMRQLSTLIGAGLPLTQSMHTVLDQTANKQLQSVIQEIAANIEAGKTLSDSFAKHPKVFDNVVISLVAAGEISGTMDKALVKIANQQEKDAAIASKIRGALTYPAIVLVVIGLVLGFMMFTVVPQVEKLYHDLKKSLPFLTQAMVDAANFAQNYWYILVIVIGIAIFLISKYIKTEAGIELYDAFKIKVPVFGKMFQKLYMARFTRTAQTLLSSGVSMLDMMDITSNAINNTLIKKSILRAADKVKGGKPLSTALEGEPLITLLVPQMIKIGEQSGQIDEMMGRVAKVYEDELDEQIATISTAIEPILMVVLAVVAGGMVGAILFPIYGLVNGGTI